MGRLKTDDRVWFEGDKQPYRVRATSIRFAICTRPAFGTVLYTIIDFLRDVRGPDDRIFSNGYETDEQITENIEALKRGDLNVSRRRDVPLKIARIEANGK